MTQFLNHSASLIPTQSNGYLITIAVLLAICITLVIGLLHYRRQMVLARHNSRDAHQHRRELQERNQLLLAEVHHRIKNNLYTISNILNLQASSIDNPAAQEALSQAVHRLISMSVLYDKLYQPEMHSRVSLQLYLPALAREILTAITNLPIELKIDIDDSMVDSKIAASIGIIVNETISNSVKHGFHAARQQKSNRMAQDSNTRPITTPSITISACTNQHQILLCIADNGSGIEPLATNQQQGFGMELIELSARQLKASLKIQQEEGTRLCLDIPL